MSTTFANIDQLRDALARGHKIDRAGRDPYWMNHVFEDTWYLHGDVKRLEEEGKLEIERGEYFHELKAVGEESGK